MRPMIVCYKGKGQIGTRKQTKELETTKQAAGKIGCGHLVCSGRINLTKIKIL